jgi:nitroreductase
VWIATEVEQRRRVLALQDGHQGFGEQAAAVAVVTVDTSAFHTVAERHQAWVDGGLFAMTLLYALQHEGLGTCCLNWCVQPSTDRRFKRSVGIPLHETVVMLIAIGALPDEFTVAHSPRRPLDEVMHGLGSHT